MFLRRRRPAPASVASGRRRGRAAARRPTFEADGFVTVTFRPNPEVRAVTGEYRPTGEVTDQVTGEVAARGGRQGASPAPTGEVTDEAAAVVRLLQASAGGVTRQHLQEALGLKHEDHFRLAYLLPALRAGLVAMTIPDKPRSSRQRYRLTPAGRRYLSRTDRATR